jgi:hypothetical protein
LLAAGRTSSPSGSSTDTSVLATSHTPSLRRQLAAEAKQRAHTHTHTHGVL